MALLFIDGFDHYAADDILKKWTSFTQDAVEARFAFGTGRFSGNSINIDLIASDNINSAARININPATEDIFLGAAFKFTEALSGDGNIFIFYDDVFTPIASVRMESSGQISIGTGAGTTFTALDTTTVTVSQDSWNYLEVHYIPDNTTGTIELKVNETVEAVATGVDTTSGNATVRAVGISGSPVDNVHHYDDMYILDTSGTSNNTYLGDVTVYTEVPTTDTTEASFSPSTGTDHFAMVDDATDIDDDSTYVENATLGATDRYTSAALGVTGTVHGVQISTTSRKTDSKTRGFKSSIKSGATEKEDTSEHLLTASYIVYRDIYEVDPNTSSAWTVTNVDSLEFGFKITTAE